MDQEPASDALASPSTRKLNARAPEFVPRFSSTPSSAAAPPPPPPLLQPVYARPPAFAPPPPPPPYYGYENYYQQNVPPFYGYNVNPVGAVEFPPEGSNGGAAGSKKCGLSDAHQKIINQVEFYFSDINLATTDQLFRFMSKDPEGYVPMSVVASFKKIKTAITDSAQLANILRNSNKLLVSEDGKKVKRLHPLTESDMEELQCRIIVAENLPEDHSHQNLMKIFSSVGGVKSIRTCPPQSSNGGASSSSKTGRGDGLHFGKFHAFVEYESVEAAEKAVAELKEEGNWRNCLKVRLLLKSAAKPCNVRAKKVAHEGPPSGKRDEAAAPEMQGSKEHHYLDELLRQSDAQNTEVQMENNTKGNNAQRKGRGVGNNNSKGKGRGQGRGRPHHPSPSNTNTNSEGNALVCPPSEGSEKVNAGKASPVPRMPDGTKGFSMGRGKAVTVKSA